MHDFNTLEQFLSFALKRQSNVLDLEMDIHGWVKVDELIEKLNKDRTEPISLKDINAIVIGSEKSEFLIEKRSGKSYIKYNDGWTNSNKVSLVHNALTPPDVLYYGTTTKHLSDILKHGILSRRKKFVHLDLNVEQAKAMIKQQGVPIVYKVDCKSMINDGVEFYKSDKNIWMTKRIAKKYLTFVDKGE